MKVRTEVDLLAVAKTLGNAVAYNQGKFFNLFFTQFASSSKCCDEMEIRLRGLADLLNPTARQVVVDLAEMIQSRPDFMPVENLPPVEPTPAKIPTRKPDTTPVTITLPAHLARKLLGDGGNL